MTENDYKRHHIYSLQRILDTGKRVERMDDFRCRLILLTEKEKEELKQLIRNIINSI